MEFSFDPGVLVAFVMITTRLVTVFVVAPPFSGALMPNRMRIALAVALSFAIAPGSVTAQPGVLPTDLIGLVGALLFQVFAGILLGLTIQLLFAALSSAGSMIDMAAGLSSAALYDPSTGSQVATVGRMYQFIGITILFVINGHLLLIKGVIRSYEAAPLTGLRLDQLESMVTEGAAMFFLAAVEIAFPIMLTMALTEIVLGVASRAAPKLNALVIGFALKSLILLLILSMTLPLVLNGAEAMFLQGLRWGSQLIGG